ncbi:uncharacterized protein [Physcomitrium patens]|uniref:Single-stranded DNA-binding protein, mitochondrial n=1 Tax=Physcomitrium patens TaxID=3218 RepID=A0A7I4DYA9_PHYPA|nr:single-stranded DNA-binding protein-like isoform X2 [Physcomitrium patens]|eukprot:XP_024377145.1 single-stranded DNA-binding protein-like isoform X2 [Physcomitrella patens]
MASQLSLAVTKRLYSVGAAGSLRALGFASAETNRYSTQDVNDDSRDGLLEMNTQVPESNQSASDATLDYFSFDSQAFMEYPSSGDQINQSERVHNNGYSLGRVYQPRGVHKAILLGKVGQAPAQKVLKSGRAVTIFSVGTGGMHLNRKMLDGETPEEFAERSSIQWHRIAVYQERIGQLILRSMKQGSQVYVEGNIETRIYNDPNTQQVKRIREIAVRQNGRLLFMEAASTARESQHRENPLKSLEPITRRSEIPD